GGADLSTGLWQGGQDPHLHPLVVSRVIKKAARRAGLEVAQVYRSQTPGRFSGACSGQSAALSSNQGGSVPPLAIPLSASTTPVSSTGSRSLRQASRGADPAPASSGGTSGSTRAKPIRPVCVARRHGRSDGS